VGGFFGFWVGVLGGVFWVAGQRGGRPVGGGSFHSTVEDCERGFPEGRYTIPYGCTRERRGAGDMAAEEPYDCGSQGSSVLRGRDVQVTSIKKKWTITRGGALLDQKGENRLARDFVADLCAYCRELAWGWGIRKGPCPGVEKRTTAPYRSEILRQKKIVQKGWQNEKRGKEAHES